MIGVCSGVGIWVALEADERCVCGWVKDRWRRKGRDEDAAYVGCAVGWLSARVGGSEVVGGRGGWIGLRGTVEW